MPPHHEFRDLKTFPEDFQQLLNDLAYERLLDGIPKQVRVSQGRLSDHEEEWLENEHNWTAEDYERAQAYLEWLQELSYPPPLVADTVGGLLRDGYHRWWVLRQAGYETYDFIYLDQQVSVVPLETEEELSR